MLITINIDWLSFFQFAVHISCLVHTSVCCCWCWDPSTEASFLFCLFLSVNILFLLLCSSTFANWLVSEFHLIFQIIFHFLATFPKQKACECGAGGGGRIPSVVPIRMDWLSMVTYWYLREGIKYPRCYFWNLVKKTCIVHDVSNDSESTLSVFHTQLSIASMSNIIFKD